MHLFPFEGFTQWSSTHAPEQVFALLESLYSAFDQIAGRRRVFKVETVRKSLFAWVWTCCCC